LLGFCWVSAGRILLCWLGSLGGCFGVSAGFLLGGFPYAGWAPLVGFPWCVCFWRVVLSLFLAQCLLGCHLFSLSYFDSSGSLVSLYSLYSLYLVLFFVPYLVWNLLTELIFTDKILLSNAASQDLFD